MINSKGGVSCVEACNFSGELSYCQFVVFGRIRLHDVGTGRLPFIQHVARPPYIFAGHNQGLMPYPVETPWDTSVSGNPKEQ